MKDRLSEVTRSEEFCGRWLMNRSSEKLQQEDFWELDLALRKTWCRVLLWTRDRVETWLRHSKITTPAKQTTQKSKQREQRERWIQLNQSKRRKRHKRLLRRPTECDLPLAVAPFLLDLFNLPCSDGDDSTVLFMVNFVFAVRWIYECRTKHRS